MSAALAIAEPAHSRVAALTSGAVAAIVPQTFDDVYRFSQVLARSGLCPYGMDTPEKVSVAILTGLEIGVKPMQAVQGIAVIGGRPSVWGDLALGIVRSASVFEYIRETYEGTPPQDWKKPQGDELNFKAVCVVKRKGEPETTPQEFSISDAIQANLWMKSGPKGPTPWVTNPKRMLKMRARGFALRDTFADVLKGMIIAEEMIGSEEDEGAPSARKRESGPPPAPALPSAAPKQIEQEIAEARDVVPGAEAMDAGAAAPTPSSEAPASEPSRSTEEDAFDPEALVVEICDQYQTASALEHLDEIETLFAEDLDKLSREQRRRVEDAIEAAQKRLAKPADAGTNGEQRRQEPAGQARVAGVAEPFVIPEDFADADAYARWLGAAIRATTSFSMSPLLREVWNRTEGVRFRLGIVADRLEAMRKAVEARIAELSAPDSQEAAEPASNAPEAESAPSGNPTTWAEYEAEARRRLSTDGGVKTWAWWESGADLRDSFDPAPTFYQKRDLKMVIVAARKAEQGEG